MRSLLSRLLRHIRDHGVDPGDFLDKILEWKSKGMLSLDDLKNLCDLVSRAVSFFHYEPTSRARFWAFGPNTMQCLSDFRCAMLILVF